jgi:hypothetical protein
MNTTLAPTLETHLRKKMLAFVATNIVHVHGKRVAWCTYVFIFIFIIIIIILCSSILARPPQWKQFFVKYLHQVRPSGWVLPNSMGYVTSESNPIIRKKIK